MQHLRQQGLREEQLRRDVSNSSWCLAGEAALNEYLRVKTVTFEY